MTFQHTATRRWLLFRCANIKPCFLVSTHSHPKVAADYINKSISVYDVSTHSHPKVAAGQEFTNWLRAYKFQHTATRRWLLAISIGAMIDGWFQHTATRRWLLKAAPGHIKESVFQHTATRRWLHFTSPLRTSKTQFQHTATRRWLHLLPNIKANRFCSFNTQPPEGGCGRRYFNKTAKNGFQHTATRRWLPLHSQSSQWFHQFQHTATRRWLLLT